MSKNRWIFYLVFAVFHVGAFIFTLKIQNLTFLSNIYSYIPWFKYITFIGIVLIVADVIWSWILNRESQKEKDALVHENNTLKAKLFDLQESAKTANAAKPAPKN